MVIIFIIKDFTKKIKKKFIECHQSSLSFICFAALAIFSSSSLVNLGLSLTPSDEDLRKVTSFPSAVVTVSYLSGFLLLSKASHEFSNADISKYFCLFLLF